MSFKLISSLIIAAASLVSVPAFAQAAGTSAAGMAEGSIVVVNGVTFTVIGGVLVASTSKGTTPGTATSTATGT